MLLDLPKSRPAVRQSMIKDLGARCLPSIVPQVRQLHANAIQAGLSSTSQMAADLNNPAAKPNAVVIVSKQPIHLHRHILKKRCPVLADSLSTCQPLLLDIKCPATGIIISYEATLTFLRLLYSGELAWPSGASQVATAEQLLILACKYKVPYLIAATEVLPESTVQLDNCCRYLALAKCHGAPQLYAFSLHVVRSGHCSEPGLTWIWQPNRQSAVVGAPDSL